MAAISEAESTTYKFTRKPCDVDAVGDKTLTYTVNGRVYGYSMSVLQVRILPGREHCDIADVNVNVACAYKIWQSQGYKAWTQYTNGEYLKYLRRG